MHPMMLRQCIEGCLAFAPVIIATCAVSAAAAARAATSWTALAQTPRAPAVRSLCLSRRVAAPLPVATARATPAALAAPSRAPATTGPTRAARWRRRSRSALVPASRAAAARTATSSSAAAPAAARRSTAAQRTGLPRARAPQQAAAARRTLAPAASLSTSWPAAAVPASTAAATPRAGAGLGDACWAACTEEVRESPDASTRARRARVAQPRTRHVGAAQQAQGASCRHC